MFVDQIRDDCDDWNYGFCYIYLDSDPLYHFDDQTNHEKQI